MSGSEGTIRLETSADHPAITDLVSDAFGRAFEARLVERLRSEHPDAFGPALVAEVDGRVVGYVCCSEMRIDEAPDVPLLGLGPIAVLPAHQAMGIGSALMRRIHAIATVPVALVGDPAWYSRFGYRAAAPLGLRSQWNDMGDEWQIWFPPGVDAPRYRGTARYLPPFDEEEPVAVDGGGSPP